MEPFSFSFFSIIGRGIDLHYHNIEWFALEMNRIILSFWYVESIHFKESEGNVWTQHFSFQGRKNADVTAAISHFFKVELLQRAAKQHNLCDGCGGGCLVTYSCSTLVTSWRAAHQAPLSTGFPRQEYWSGLPFPSPGHLLDPWGSNPRLLLGRWILYH